MNPTTGLGFDAVALESLAEDWRHQSADRPHPLPDDLSPCRIDHAKGPRRHRCSRWHADIVTGYRDARHRYLLGLEKATMLWPAEVEEYRRDHPPVTLRTWLQQNRTTP